MMRTLRRMLALLLLLAVPAPAAEDAGGALYVRYCASCHGREGRGDGPVAPALGEKPTNLSRIAAEHGGEFPFVAVMEAIDGTRTVRAHGLSEMPIWGDVFQATPGAPIEQQLLAAGKIIAITRHVRTLQTAQPPSH
jgi:mono/diheme cytochrome c family protein